MAVIVELSFAASPPLMAAAGALIVFSSSIIPLPQHAVGSRSRNPPRFLSCDAPPLVSSLTFAFPSALRLSSRRRVHLQKTSFSVRCGQRAKTSNGLDIWLGRLAMVGFATAITVEIATGKGLLKNFGFTTPIPTLALIVTALVGVLTAFFIFQSASRD